jgi:hypothetical protein
MSRSSRWSPAKAGLGGVDPTLWNGALEIALGSDGVL